MFTGLIQTTGTLSSFGPSRAATRLMISAPELAGLWKSGDSIAVNGVCLTALPANSGDAEDRPNAGHFAADLAEETLRRTTLSRLVPGSVVNLELPTLAGSRLGGHVVQGHVDGVARLQSLTALQPDPDTTDWRLSLELPEALMAHILPQGSITVDGISLTVASIQGNRVEIAIIPHTYRSTNLSSLLAGAEVNIETDVLAKYAARQNSVGIDRPGGEGNQAAAPEWLTTAYLLANGY